MAFYLCLRLLNFLNTFLFLMQKLKISLIALFIPLFFYSNAQEQLSQPKKNATQLPTQNNLNSGSISSQFDYLMSVSNNYQDYKVVKKTYLEKIKNNIIDSLQGTASKLANLNTTLNTHDTEVAALQDSLKNVEKELNLTREQKESFNFLGMYLSKGAYNAIVWSMIGLLLAALIFYIYRFKQSHTITADAKKTLEEVRDEFEQHRKRSMEREQKLNRRLQDELNKRL